MQPILPVTVPVKDQSVARQRYGDGVARCKRAFTTAVQNTLCYYFHQSELSFVSIDSKQVQAFVLYHKDDILVNVNHSLLPSANEVAERLCFYTCLSFCPRGWCLPQCMLGCTPSRADTPQQTATAADGTHPTGMHSCINQ